MTSNQAFEGGVAMIFSNSDFSTLKTKFCNNTALTNDGAIYLRQSGHTALGQCSFRYNCVDDAYSIYGSDIRRRMEGHEVRISQCEFALATINTVTFSFNRWDGSFQIRLITFKANISYGSSNLSSGDQLFIHKAGRKGWLYINGAKFPGNVIPFKQHESSYASCKYLK